MRETKTSIDDGWCMPDELWERIEPLLPPKSPHPKGGHPWTPDRQAMDGIFYRLRTGCQWKALPREFGAPSTLHDRFQLWREAEVFERLWQEGLLEYEALKGIEWEWLAMDGAMTKAPLGGEATGPNPTDRVPMGCGTPMGIGAKGGTKRSLLTDGRGVPLGVAVDGANRHDMKLVRPTLEAMVIKRPEPTEERPQNICLDKGYDYPEIENLVAGWGYTAHPDRIGAAAGRSKRERRRFPVTGHDAGLWSGPTPG